MEAKLISTPFIQGNKSYTDVQYLYLSVLCRHPRLNAECQLEKHHKGYELRDFYVLLFSYLFVTQVIVDVDSILNDFQIMGNGLVKSVDVLS